MKLCLGLFLSSICLIAPPTASAQLPRSSAPVSPYLNLLRGDNSLGVNYYGIVRPEVDFRASIQKLQQQSQTTQQAVNDIQNGSGIAPTGHVTSFMNHGTYFQSLTGGAAGASFGTTGGSSARSGGARPSGGVK